MFSRKDGAIEVRRLFGPRSIFHGALLILIPQICCCLLNLIEALSAPAELGFFVRKPTWLHCEEIPDSLTRLGFADVSNRFFSILRAANALHLVGSFAQLEAAVR